MGEINLTRGKTLEVYQYRSSLHSSVLRWCSKMVPCFAKMIHLFGILLARIYFCYTQQKSQIKYICFYFLAKNIWILPVQAGVAVP